MRSGNNTHCYIARKKCGCVVAATVDEVDYPKDTAKSVAEFLRDGLTIERVELNEFRTSPKYSLGCKCNKETP